MPEVDAESRPTFDHLEEFFGQASFWDKLIEFMAQEPVRGERHDAFSSDQARFYKSIFGLWEDKFLDVVQPVMVKLASRVDDKNSQRTAAELIGGLIRGSKHWKKGQLDGMWSWLTPLLKKTFQQCTPDSLVYWERFVKYVCLYRDPRRVLPFITLLFNTPLDPDSTAAFAESKNLFFTRAALVSLSWRVSLLTPSLREDCLKHITHPYKQVREILGHVINELFQSSPHPSYKSVKELLNAEAQTIGQRSRVVESLDEKSSHQIQTLITSLANWRQERQPSIQGSSDYTNASKTGTVSRVSSRLISGFALLINISLLFILTNCSSGMGLPGLVWLQGTSHLWCGDPLGARAVPHAGYTRRPGLAAVGDLVIVATGAICVPAQHGPRNGGYVLHDPPIVDQLACAQQRTPCGPDLFLHQPVLDGRPDDGQGHGCCI